jgi:cell division protein FtsQ
LIEPDSVPGTAPERRSRWRIAAGIILILLIAPAAWLAQRSATKMEYFHVRSVRVEGTTYLDPALVIERLGIDTMRSVWEDTKPLADRVRSLPQVGDVVISRRLPGTLVVSIRENLPVALSPSPRGLEPVDSAGVVLPIDPTRANLDLPIALQRDAPMLALLGAMRSQDPILFGRLSEIGRDGRDGIVMQLEPRERPAGALAPDSAATDSAGTRVQRGNSRGLRVRAMLGVSVARLADIFPVESDLLRRRANVAELDLRYRDQVIARLQ